jgi:hypothetical protein
LGQEFRPTRDPPDRLLGWNSKLNISHGNLDTSGIIHDCKWIAVFTVGDNPYKMKYLFNLM